MLSILLLLFFGTACICNLTDGEDACRVDGEQKPMSTSDFSELVASQCTTYKSLFMTNFIIDCELIDFDLQTSLGILSLD